MKTNKIKLKCPKCKRTKMVKREPHDPKNAKAVLCACDKCSDSELIDYEY